MRIDHAAVALICISIPWALGCHEAPSINAVAAADHPAVQPSSAKLADDSNWNLERKVNPATGVVTSEAYLSFSPTQNIYIRQIGKKLECYITTSAFLETMENVESHVSTVQ